VKRILFCVLAVAIVAGCGAQAPVWFAKTAVEPANVSSQRTGQTKITVTPPSAADAKTIEPAVLPPVNQPPAPVAQPMRLPPYVWVTPEAPVFVRLGDKVIQAPAGSSVAIQVDDLSKATGSGAGYATSGGDLKMDTTAPTANLSDTGGMFSSGGGLNLDIKGLLKGGSVLYWIGGLMIVVGIAVAFVLKQYLWGGVLAGAGLVLIVVAATVEAYPWVWLIGLAVGIGVAAWYIYRVYKSGQTSATLETVVHGIESAGASASAAVKNAIGSVAAYKGTGDKVKGVISKVKTDLGINPTPTPTIVAAPPQENGVTK
jgi:hypothetical protein